MGKQSGKYSSPRQPARSNRTGIMVAVMLAFVLAAAGGTVLLLRNPPAVLPRQESLQATEATTQPPTEAATVPSNTPVVTPTNDKALVTCKASYTVSPGSGSAEKTVATAGSRKLTNGMLQILYLSQVNDYRASHAEIAPDFSRPLDCQPCPLEEGLSWQHYFLKAAILGWQAQQAALEQAQQPRIITEEAYKPNLTDNLHEKNIAPELPVNNFLYKDQDCYTPNRLHQAYLDSLEDTLDTLAAQAGFEDLDAMAQGLGVSAGDYLQAARDYNTAYMLFTEERYDIDPTDGEVCDYLQEHAAELSLPGGSGETMDIRHILLIPQGAAVGADGKVTATAAQWQQAEQQAQEILEEWEKASQRQDPDSAFAQLANTYSQDEGTRLDGGYYYSLQPGQLMEPLNEWCVSNGRQQGDTAILRSDYGCHILYLAAFREANLTDARTALVTQLVRDNWLQWLKKVPLTPDYSAAELWVDTTVNAVSLTDALYPDIAHERFPEAIVYFQQDYHYYPFGSECIGLNGCGIATYAMLATYMTDSIQSPAMMSDRFGKDYYDFMGHGTNGDIFRDTPPQMGFYLDKSTTDIVDVVAALEKGQVAISLQGSGTFTSKGHYLLLMHYYPEDDTIQVRDSNIYNYNHVRGHQTDRFSRTQVANAGIQYYIMQPKITAIPACARCGSGETGPAALLTQDYTCHICSNALARRNSFLSLLEELSH